MLRGRRRDWAGAVALAAARAGGDARAALQILELASATAAAAGESISEEHVLDASRKRPLRYDRKGDQHYDFISAFIKSMRGGDADAAVYYLAAMLEAGEDARFVARIDAKADREAGKLRIKAWHWEAGVADKKALRKSIEAKLAEFARFQFDR